MVHGEIHVGGCDKRSIVSGFIQGREIDRCYVIGEPLGFEPGVPTEYFPWNRTDCYTEYYHLLQVVGPRSLIVLNECLKSTERNGLKYNCIRKYMIQTPHRLVFNYWPILKQERDFAILYDMISDNPWWKEKYEYITEFEGVTDHGFEFVLEKVDIRFSQEVVEQYAVEKRRAIEAVKKDPDIIPRRLLKFSEGKKPRGFDSLARPLPRMRVCVSQLGVDRWYYGELLKFGEELEHARAAIHDRAKV